MFSSRKRLKRNVDPNNIPRFNFQEFVENSTPDILASLSEDQVSEGSLTTEEIFRVLCRSAGAPVSKPSRQRIQWLTKGLISNELLHPMITNRNSYSCHVGSQNLQCLSWKIRPDILQRTELYDRGLDCWKKDRRSIFGRLPEDLIRIIETFLYNEKGSSLPDYVDFSVKESEGELRLDSDAIVSNFAFSKVSRYGQLRHESLSDLRLSFETRTPLPRHMRAAIVSLEHIRMKSPFETPRAVLSMPAQCGKTEICIQFILRDIARVNELFKSILLVAPLFQSITNLKEGRTPSYFPGLASAIVQGDEITYLPEGKYSKELCILHDSFLPLHEQFLIGTVEFGATRWERFRYESFCRAMNGKKLNRGLYVISTTPSAESQTLQRVKNSGLRAYSARKDKSHPPPEQSVIVLSHQSMTIGKFTFYLNRRFHVRTFFLDEYHEMDLLRFLYLNPDMIVLVSATAFSLGPSISNHGMLREHGPKTVSTEGDWSPKMLPCGVCEACADGTKSCTRSKAFNEDLQLYFRELMRCCDSRLQSQGYDDGKSMISLRGARALFRVLDWIVVSGEVPRETIAGCRSLRRSAFSEEIVDLGLVVPAGVSQKIVTSLTKIKKTMHHASQASSDPFLRIQRALGPIWYARTDDGRNLSDRVAQVVFDRLAREVRDTVVVHSSDVHLNLTRLVEGEYMFRDKVYRIERQDGDQRDRLFLPNRTLDHLVLPQARTDKYEVEVLFHPSVGNHLVFSKMYLEPMSKTPKLRAAHKKLVDLMGHLNRRFTSVRRLPYTNYESLSEGGASRSLFHTIYQDSSTLPIVLGKVDVSDPRSERSGGISLPITEGFEPEIMEAFEEVLQHALPSDDESRVPCPNISKIWPNLYFFVAPQRELRLFHLDAVDDRSKVLDAFRSEPTPPAKAHVLIVTYGKGNAGISLGGRCKETILAMPPYSRDHLHQVLERTTTMQESTDPDAPATVSNRIVHCCTGPQLRPIVDYNQQSAKQSLGASSIIDKLIESFSRGE